MDASGRIYSAEQRREMERGGIGAVARVDAEAIRRKLKQLVDIPSDQLAQLVALPRAQRRAWYADYRRNMKRARRTGGEVKIPPVPTLPGRA